MKAAASKYGAISERLAGAMTRAQALRLKGLAEEAYQPGQFAANLSLDEAARRIDNSGDRAGGLVLEVARRGGDRPVISS